MTEDFNEGPIIIEDKQCLLTNKENCSLCGNKDGLIECGICGLKFCNNIHENKSDIMYHIQNSNHNSIKIITNKDFPNKYEELKCCKCGEKNIFELFFLLSNENNCIDINKTVFCKKDIPKNCDVQPIVQKEEKIEKTNNDLIIKKPKNSYSNKRKVNKQMISERQKILNEFDEIVTRKLNKVKLSYENKYDYYEIYKPLIVADYLYTKKVYDNKSEYDINLLVNKNEKYYFKIPEDFIEINFSPGRVLKFMEVDKYEYYDENDLDEDYEPIEFVGVITNIIFNDNNQLYDIWIMPLNKHITSLKGHDGPFKIKEEFCSIPFMRMLEALELFQTDEIDEYNEGAVSLYLVRRILGQYPSEEQIKNKKNLENLSSFKKDEEKALNSLFGKDIISKIEKSIDNYGKLNESQILSINNVFKNILNLIQGPPGTGKTFLSSFIIYNIYKYRKDKSNKILLCAPSNSATDNLALSLLKINKVTGEKMKILRVFAKSREYITDIENELLNASLHKKLQEKLNIDDISEVPKDDLQEEIDEIITDYDIVIATCSTSWDERISKQNFPFVIIDEVTQCCEIESLIAVVHGCKHLTLIGDQKQLGPVILHPKAESTGMKVSLFERMLKLYPELLNKLKIQYRMHEEIIKFPSMEFYNNEIQNFYPKEARTNKEFNSQFNWPNKNIPLIFIHVEGKEIVIRSGKSKQNEEEAIIAALFIKKLTDLNINLNNIGIITPYSAQKILIRKKLKEKYKTKTIIENLKISSVDGFQGREKDFIIVSNVRSNEDNGIGFLRDFRRLNVSITRAKYGMIIIGNAKCLYEDSDIWAKFISYYQKNDLLVEPEIKKYYENDKEICEFNIDELNKISGFNENLDDSKISYQEYDFDASSNEPNINEDLLNNFECSENVYAEGNKKYYRKKKEKKNKKKNKNKNKYKNQYYK